MDNKPSDKSIDPDLSPLTSGHVNAKNPKERQEASLRKLATLFDIAELGNVDRDAGLNTVVSMALTITAVSAPESAIRHAGGSLPIGQNWLVSGALSESLLNEIQHAALSRQDHFTSHIEYHRLASESAKAKDSSGKLPIPHSLSMSAVTWALDQHSPYYQPGALFQPLHSPSPDLLYRQNRLLVKVGNAPGLAAAVDKAHGGRLLACIPVRNAAQTNALGPILHDFMHGSCIGLSFRSVEGIVSATLPTASLAAIQNQAASDWVHNLLWLLDAPGLPACPAADGSLPVLDDVRERYRDAVIKVMEARVRRTGCSLPKYGSDFTKSQMAYMRFLQSLEADYPGITGACRKLPATLIYGLHQMLIARRCKPGVGWSFQDACGLSRHLVTRMVLARRKLTDDGNRARLLTLASRLAIKLEQAGPCDVRRLTRKTHGLTVNQCEEALLTLLEAGFVRDDGGKWSLLRPAAEFLSHETQTPVIDV